MNALEDEPESGGRFRVMCIGAFVAIGLGVSLVFGAEHLEPARKLLAKVIPIKMVDVPIQKVEEPPPPPPVDLPKPKPIVKQKSVPAPAKEQEAQPEPSKTNEPLPPETVGLDADSFGTGSGGPAFHMGTSQMGVPTGVKGGFQNPQLDQRLVEAKSLPGNLSPVKIYERSRARRMNIHGLMIIETDINERGLVTRAVVRGGLEPDLDEATRKIVEKWKFEPAKVAGKPVKSTKFLRIRFELY